MAYVTKKVSDLSGTEGPEDQFVTLIVRKHPAIDRPVTLDVLPDEIKDMKSAGDIVTVEVRPPSGQNHERHVRVADFNKLAAKMEEILQNAPGTRGRRPGSRNGV